MARMSEFKSDLKKNISNGFYWKSSETILSLIKQAYLLYIFGISSYLDDFYLAMSFVTLSIYALGESFDLYLISQRVWDGKFRDIKLLMYIFIVALFSLMFASVLVVLKLFEFAPFIKLLPVFFLIATFYFPYRYFLTYLKLQNKINAYYFIEFFFSSAILFYIICIDSSFSGLFYSIFFSLAGASTIAFFMIEKSPIQFNENLSLSGFLKIHVGNIFDFTADVFEKTLLGKIGVGLISIFSYTQYAVLFLKKVILGSGVYVHLFSETNYDTSLKNRFSYVLKLFLVCNLIFSVVIFGVNQLIHFGILAIDFHRELLFFASFIIIFVAIDFFQKIIYIKNTNLVLFLKIFKIIFILVLYTLSKSDVINYGLIYLFWQYTIYFLLTLTFFYFHLASLNLGILIKFNPKLLFLSSLAFALNMLCVALPF
jgi:hypothetical protein